MSWYASTTLLPNNFIWKKNVCGMWSFDIHNYKKLYKAIKNKLYLWSCLALEGMTYHSN